MPTGPNGESFDGATHQHYKGYASSAFAETDLQAGLNNLLEHYAKGQANIYINQAQETALRGYTDFRPLYEMATHVDLTKTYALGTLDVIQIYNRKVGTYHGAEVWVKPWMPAGYIFLFLTGAPKPLVWRNPEFVMGREPGENMATVLANPLTLVSEDEEHPLRSKQYERDFGISCWNRTNGVVLDTAHLTTYTAPTL